MLITTVLLAVSCTQICPDESETVNISISGTLSRVSGGSNDSRVSSLQAYIFREDGTLESSGTSESSDIVLSVVSGKKTIVAIANSPQPEVTGKIDALRNSLSLLSDNAPDALVMYGEQTADIHSDINITVEMKRLASKISIKRINNRLGSRYRDMELIINSVFLINVAGSSSFGRQGLTQFWLNKRAFSPNDCPSLLFDSLNDTAIRWGESYDTVHSFYCYPNQVTEDSSQDEWCPRFTRLVVQASLGGKTYWYPVSIPDIKQNCIYEITELTITRPGSDNPDIPVTWEDIELNLDITPWDNGTSEEITI